CARQKAYYSNPYYFDYW
nr:immunoglobulin heavy chain junction region [Mus musculus]